MEQQEKQFEAIIKRSVAMYSMLTGKPMTEREGRTFIEIFDMTEAYLANGESSDKAAETFNTLSSVDIPVFRGRPIIDNGDGTGRTFVPRTEVFTDPASPFGDHSVTAEVGIDERGDKTVTKITTRPEPLDICGCPVGCCTCTDQMIERLRQQVEGAGVDIKTPNIDAAAKKAGIDPKVLRTFALAESSENKTPIGGIVETEEGQFKNGKRYTPPPITSADRDHIPGYDWQICVLSREKNTEDSYIVHYAQMPTQAQFSEHFVKFHERTHYVHVNEWVNYGWEGITEHYDRSVPTSSLTRKNEVVRTAPAPELRGCDVSAPPTTSPWEQKDKAWRIRYYSDVTGAVIFAYVDKRPTSAEMAHFHHAKCMAVSQARPKDAA